MVIKQWFNNTFLHQILFRSILGKDGYIAPITAGNFIDLCLRHFYTGLPIKENTTTKFSAYQDPFDTIPKNNLGSYNEGFFSPLTGQLRQIPLEIIRIEGMQKLSYPYTREAKLLPETNHKPLLSFKIPGLIALNHPSDFPNGGSSELFGLKSTAANENAAKLLDGAYAPFGYIISGYDIFDSLRPGDVIESTSVDQFGQLNLVTIRSSTFKEVAMGTEEVSSKKE